MRPTWGMRWSEADGASFDDPTPWACRIASWRAVAGPQRVGEEDDHSPRLTPQGVARVGQAVWFRSLVETLLPHLTPVVQTAGVTAGISGSCSRGNSRGTRIAHGRVDGCRDGADLTLACPQEATGAGERGRSEDRLP